MQQTEQFLLAEEGDTDLHFLLAQRYLELGNVVDAEYHVLLAKR